MLDLSTSIPALTVFLQGILSFFSPCVLPLVPLYVAYLAGGTKTVDENGVIHYPRKKVMVNTFFFVIGISFTFFLLGFGFTALGRFFSSHQRVFTTVSGLIMILFGLYQLGVFGHSTAIEREHRLPFRLDKVAMNPITALALGFTFSFAWTPCVGPTLGSVLLMASSVSNAGAMANGFVLIGVYTLGFVIPFLAVGLFTGVVLEFFRTHKKVVQYTVKIGAVLLILMGIMTLTGFMNGVTGYFSAAGTPEPPAAEETSAPEREAVPAPDFTLEDQFGNVHTLSDYEGKTIFLNFFATWCGPCQSEMPEIQKLYETHGLNQEDVVVLAVSSPKSEEYPNNRDHSVEKVKAFLDDNGYTFPVLLDMTGEVSDIYNIRAFPTTYMLDADGNVYGYVISALSLEQMESIVQQTQDAIPAGE